MSKKSKGHQKHVCALIGCDDLTAVIPLVIDARYICERCGRAAHKKKSLCRPRKLELPG